MKIIKLVIVQIIAKIKMHNLVNTIKTILKNNFFILGLVWNISRTRFVIKIIVTIISSILPTINIIIVRYVISLLESDINRTEAMLMQLFVVLLALMFMQLIPKIFFAINSALIEPFLASKINNFMNEVFFDKAKMFEYKNFEDPVFYDKYTRALAQTENITHTVFNAFFQLIGSFISIFALSALIISMDWIVIFFALFSVFVNFIETLISGKLNFNTTQALTPISRRQNYIKRVLYNSAYAKEIQENDVILTGKRYYFESFSKLLHIIKKYGVKIACISIITTVLTTISSTLMMFYLFSRVWGGLYTIAEYSALMSSSSQFEGTLKSFFDNITSFYKNSLEIDNLKYIYFYKRTDPDGELSLDANTAFTIEFKNVSFRYPNSDKYALKNVSLKINSGDKISLVGANGSGKTTMIKLLMGLYQPQVGKILINGISIQDIKHTEIQKKISAVFQDYQIFAFTIKENICFEGEMTSQAQDVLERLDMKSYIDKLPKGMDTPLSKEFDTEGTLVSGGEAQKICIARAINKKAGLYIFDEPSSALDPIAEYNMNNMLYDIIDKTTIFISHRLTTATMADTIFLLSSGQIEEQGTHKELLQKKGLYFDLFSRQAERYDISNEDKWVN